MVCGTASVRHTEVLSMNHDSITALVENCAFDKCLRAEHGLSLYIEFQGLRILFDCGQSDAFSHNASVLGVDLTKIDHCLISHGHYDHTGGLERFVSLNDHAPVWIRQGTLCARYNSKNEYIGIPPHTKTDSPRFRQSSGFFEIADSVFVFGPAPLYDTEDSHTKGFFKNSPDNDTKTDDLFEDEQSLVLVKHDSMTVISGCSHRGITNIIRQAVDHFKLPVSLLIGGFHLRSETEENRKKVIEKVSEFGIGRIGMCHCSGIDSYCLMKRKMNEAVFYCHCGKKTVF